MDKPDLDTFAFADVTLDLARGRLFRAGQDIALRPKSLALLTHLVRNAGGVLSKEALMAAVWPDVTVTEDSLTQCIHEVRRALGPEGSRLLRTVPRRGYLFDPEDIAVPARAAAAPASPARLRPDGIAVLPFALSNADDPTDATLVQGLVQDVTAGLSTFRGLHVISVGSAYAVRQVAEDPRSVGRALGVLYVVSGIADFRGNRVRLRVEFAEAERGSIVWTGEYVEDRADFLNLIGGVTGRIAQTLFQQVWAAEARRALERPVESLDAWQNFHAALPHVQRSDAQSIAFALERFRAATDLSPRFARAWSGQSAAHFVLALTGLSQDVAADVAAARHTGTVAISLDPEDPFSHFSLGRAMWLEGDAEGSMQAAERSVALAPSFAFGHFHGGMIDAIHRDARRGIAKMDLFQALSPFDPGLASAYLLRGVAQYRLGEIESAATSARGAVRQPNVYATVHVPAALILAEAGHVQEARQVVARVREAAPWPGHDAIQQSVARLSPDMGALFGRHAAPLGL